MLIKNQTLIEDAGLLFANEKFAELRAWFALVENKNETEKIIVCSRSASGEALRVVVDSRVPCELIDKVMIWFRMFLPKYFRDQSPSFQRELIAFIFSPLNQYFAAPRGFSKTTVVQGSVSFMCAHRIEKFIVLIEKTFMEAAEVLNAVRSEFGDNQILRAVYGDLINSRENTSLEANTKDRDAQGDFFINGVRVKGKGFETSIRGLKSREWRPTLIICDDIEQDEHIGNSEQRQKYMDRYNSSILPAVDPDCGRVKVVGTILHLDSLLSNLIRMHNGKIYRGYYDETRPDWSDIETPKRICDGRAIKELWPSRWSYEKLMKKKAEMIGKGASSHAFYKEILNDPAGDNERQFKSSWLWNPNRRITLDEIHKSDKLFSGYAAIDTADSVRDGADFTASIVHLVDSQGNHYRVHAARERRNAPQLIDLIFDIWRTWQPFGLLKIGVEKRAFEDQIKPALDAESLRRNEFPIVEELRPYRRAKEARILANLQGRYEKGRIWTVGRIEADQFIALGATEFLLNELLDFPNSEHDDLSDAEAYCVEISMPPLNNEDGSVAKKEVKDELDKLFEQNSYSRNSDDPFE